MPVETPSVFAHVIQEHLDLKRRNSELDQNMPLDKYETEDPSRTTRSSRPRSRRGSRRRMDGQESLAPEQVVSLAPRPEQPADDDTLWGRSRDFDWGD